MCDTLDKMECDQKNSETIGETIVDPEKYFNKMKKKLKKYVKLNLSSRVYKLEKKITKFENMKAKSDNLTSTSSGSTNFVSTDFYLRLIRRSSRMLERAYLCQFLSLDLTEDVCMALLCIAEREFPETDCKLSYKAVLLNYISGRHDQAKNLLDAYNDICGESGTKSGGCGRCDDGGCDDDVCVTFSENLNFPSIGYLG